MSRRPYSAGAAAQRKAEADAMFAFYNDGPGELLAEDLPEEVPAKPLALGESSASSTRCEACGELIKTDELAQHAKNAHGAEPE